MDWQSWIFAGVLVVLFVAFRRIELVSPNRARRLLEQDGKIIDVRNRSEYQAGHLRGALNIPLGELKERIGQESKDLNQPLLLHCLGGGRSALAKRMLRQMGYRTVVNLGSYRRAKRVTAG